MPVTAKLSSDFYERLGDNVTNELVGLLNNMDAEYLTELRQQNEINFVRFDAKLEQRIAEVRAELRTGLADLRAEFKTGIADLRGEFHTELGALRAEIARAQVVQMRWMIGMLIPLYLTALATLAATLRLHAG